MNKVKRKEMVESINDHERRIHRFERLLKKNGLGFDLPELPKAGDFFEIVQHHSQKLPKGKVLEVAKVNHNTTLIKFVGGFNGYFTDFDRSVYLGGAEDEPMKPCAKPEQAEPKLKQLDQSVFAGLDADYNFAAIDGCTGRAYTYEQKPHIPVGKSYWRVREGMQNPVGYDYDATNWQNSLIERKELTGSDLCRAMLERGDKTVLCAVSDDGNFEADAYDAICRVDEDGLFESHCTFWWYVRPVNNKGEPLTQAEAGL